MKKLLVLFMLFFLIEINAATLYFGTTSLPLGNSIKIKFESAALLSAYIAHNNLLTVSDWETHLNHPDIHLVNVIVNSDEVVFVLTPDTKHFQIETGVYNPPGSSCNVINIQVNKFLTSLLIDNRLTWSTNNLEDIDLSNLISLETFTTDECTLDNITLPIYAPLNTLSITNITPLANYTGIYNYAATLKNLSVRNLPTNVDFTPMVNLEAYIPAENSNKTIDLNGISTLTQVLLVSINKDIISLNIANTAIPLSFLNDILVELDSNGLLNGYLNITGLPAPTGTGLTAKNNLISKGWTIIE